MKAAMRTELDFKFKKTDKDNSDLKFKLNKLNIQLEKTTNANQKLEDELREIDEKVDELEMGNMTKPKPAMT